MATYNPRKVYVTFNGRRITGFEPGESISADRTADEFGMQVGLDGEGGFTQNADRSGKVTLKLQQFSKSNKFLSDTMAGDSSDGTGQGTIVIADLNTDEALVSGVGRLSKPAPFNRGKEVSSHEWVILSLNLEIKHDGSSAE
jgi:hypothetical protein